MSYKHSSRQQLELSTNRAGKVSSNGFAEKDDGEDSASSTEAAFSNTLSTMIQTLSPMATKMAQSSLGIPISPGENKKTSIGLDFSSLLNSAEDDQALMMPSSGRPEELELAFRSHLLTLIGPVLLTQKRSSGVVRNSGCNNSATKILVTYVNSCTEICYQLMKLSKINPILQSVQKEKGGSTSSEDVKLLQTTIDKSTEKTDVTSQRDAQTLKALDSLTSGHLLANIPFLMLEDCIDALPMSQCCHVIWNQCIVSNDSQNKLCSTFLFPAGRLTLLRLCNKLLQKKTTTAERPTKNDGNDGSGPVDVGGGRSFMGSVLLFLAKSFPLSERSGLNVLGKLNVESNTTYEDEETFDELARLHRSGSVSGDGGTSSFDGNMREDGDIVAGKKTKTVQGGKIGHQHGQTGQIIDYTLYRTFWRVQTYLSNPNLLLGKQDNPVLWTEFLSSVKRVLTAFEGHPFSPLDYEQAHKRWMARKWQIKKTSTLSESKNPNVSSKKESGQETKNSGPMDVDLSNDGATSPVKGVVSGTAKESDSIRAPKYLTSSQLLKLQLRDPELRLHVLTQFQIIFSYLLTRVSDQTSFHARREEMINLSQKRVVNLMKSIPPSGAEHANVLQHLLHVKEPFWRAWKDHKCPPLEQFVLADDSQQASAFSLDQIDNSHSMGPAPNFRKARLRVPMLKYQRPEFFLSDGDDGYDGGHYGNPERQWKGDLGSLKMGASFKKKGCFETPTFQEYFEFYVEALDPANGIEAEYHPKNDPMFGRRGIKLLLQEGSVNFFPEINTETGDYEQVVRKVWKEQFDIDIPEPAPAITEDPMMVEDTGKEINAGENECEHESQSGGKMDVDGNEAGETRESENPDAPSVGDASVGDASSKGVEDEPSVGDANRGDSEDDDDASSRGKSTGASNYSDRSRSRSPVAGRQVNSRRSSYSDSSTSSVRRDGAKTGTYSRSRSNSMSGGGAMVGSGRTAIAAELIDDPLDSLPEETVASTQKSPHFPAELLDDEVNEQISNKDRDTPVDTSGEGSDTPTILASIVHQEEEEAKEKNNGGAPLDETTDSGRRSSKVLANEQTDVGSSDKTSRKVPQRDSFRSVEDGEEADETSDKKSSRSIPSAGLGKRGRESERSPHQTSHLEQQQQQQQKQRQASASRTNLDSNASEPERKRPRFTPPAKVAAENEQRHEPLKRSAAASSPSPPPPPSQNDSNGVPTRGDASGNNRGTSGKEGEGRGRSREPPFQRPRQFQHEQNKRGDGNQSQNQRHRKYHQNQSQNTGGGASPAKSPPPPPPPPPPSNTATSASKSADRRRGDGGEAALGKDGSSRNDGGRGRNFGGDGRRVGDDRGNGGATNSGAGGGHRRHSPGGGSGFQYRRRNFNSGRR